MNIFKINRSYIEDRFDPKYILYLQNIHDFRYKVFPLKKFLIEKPQYGTAEIGIPRTSEQQPRYIRITDINDFGELDDSLGATAENCPNEYFLYKNDFLFARSGTVGKTYLHKYLSYPAFFAGYMIRVRVDETTLLSDYLFAYTQTSFYKNWVHAIQRAAVQANINAAEYSSLPIPLPPLSVQQNIVDLYTNAQNQRKIKLEESKKLLESVDDCLLSELGIELPQKDNSLKNRIFKVSSFQLVGTRWDCSSNKNDFSLSSKKFKNVKLCDVVNINPSVHFPSNIEEITFIPMEAIDEEYGEITSNYRKKVSESAGFTRFMQGDLIWAKITPCMQNGKSAIVKKTINGYVCGSTEFFVLRCNKNKIYVNYLFYIMHLKKLLEYATNFFGGNAGQQRVSKDFLLNLEIPLPPLSKQTEIASRLQQIQNQAKQLKNEADMILQETKQKIEKMILGEEQ